MNSVNKGKKFRRYPLQIHFPVLADCVCAWGAVHTAGELAAVPVDKATLVLAKNKIISSFMQLVIADFAVHRHKEL